jgi:FkbM family methyltransferase
MLRALRPLVERFPSLAVGYRAFRDLRAFREESAVRTPHGFLFAGNSLVQNGDYETEETLLLKKYLADAGLFVDIGANRGYYTCLAKSLGVHVLAFEPLEENLRYLFRNLDENRYARVEVFPLGLGAQPGFARLYNSGTGASLLCGWAGGSPGNCRTIALSTLDITLGRRFQGTKMVVKVDVEGAEHLVLQGAQRTLVAKPRPVWLVEICFREHQPSGAVNPHFEDIFKLFAAQGYQAFTANRDCKTVTLEDVRTWVLKGQCKSGTYNYLFT